MGNLQGQNRADEILSREQILKNYDPKLSFMSDQAIKLMDQPGIGGVSDVGRLMQIQTFRKKRLIEGRREFGLLETWRQHYMDSGIPFLVVPGDGTTCYIYKYRVIQDRHGHALNHRRRRLEKLNALKNA